ncbi:MAG: TonB-dependent receptor [Cryomorphaceae bacterium]
MGVKISVGAIFGILGLTTISQAQIVQVKDQLSHLPMEMVNVASYGTNQVVTTDTRGHAKLETFVANHQDSIVFSQIGYRSKSFHFDSLGPGERYTVYLEKSPFALDEVVISAARWKQEKRDIPVKVVTITPEDVQFQAPQTAADLLSRSGEVYVQKSQLGGGSPMIRGFATNRVLLTVDGVRMNNAIFRGGNLQNVISIDALSIESSEVIYGPGSVIYGSDALGGVMSFYTLDPRFSQNDELLVKGSALLPTSSANFEKTGHFDLTVGGKRWAATTSVSYTDYDDLRMGSSGPEAYLRPEYAVRIDGVDTVLPNPDPEVQSPTGYNQVNLLQKIKVRPSEHTEVNYSFIYANTSDLPRYDRLIRHQGDQLRSAEWYYGPQEWMMHALRIENDNRNFFYHKMRVTMAYQFFKESRHDRNFGSDRLTSRTERVNAYSLNIDMEQDLGARHELFYGAEWITNTIDSRGMDKDITTGQTFAAPSRYPNDAAWTSAAGYLTDRFRLTESLTVLSGIRYNIVRIDAIFDTTFYDLPVTETSLDMGALNGSAGLAYRPTERLQVNLNFATGFRAPNIDDIGKVFDSEPGAVVVPNSDLRPEYAYNLDLGITKVFGEALKVDATGFYTILENAMVRRDFQLNGQDSIIYDRELSRVQAIQNAAWARVYGVQAGFEWKMGSGFSLASRINVQDGEEQLDDGSYAPLRHAAPVFGMTRLTYERERLRVQFSADYNAAILASEMPPSEQAKDYLYALDQEGAPYSPAWYTFSVRGMYTVNDNVVLTGGVENLLDVRYRPYSSGVTAPGRNFQASVRVLF